jgi:DtxR family Mn-dependent transcriptional regulator
MSESVDMYLVTVALLRKDSQPVPLSQLAERLSISAVSANEMCHRLGERGLVEYQPYKGVTLTSEGEALAQRVLSRRHIWEAFLVGNLGIEPSEANEIACQLEHITSDKLIEALSCYLETSPNSSAGVAAAPRGAVAQIQTPVKPLSELCAGQQGQVVAINADEMMKEFLCAQGIQPGATLDVLVVGKEGSILLSMAGQHLSLVQPVAASIKIAPF